MVRYTVQMTRKMLEQKFQHWVDIQNPDGGFWRIHDAIFAWHRVRGIDWINGNGGPWHTRYCFANSETADAFAREFGGNRVTAEPPRRAVGR